MQVWLTTFVVVFVFVQVVLWVKQFILPLPFYLIAGAFLAIASNYEKAKLLFPTSTEDKEG